MTRGIPILFIDLNITILGIVPITDYSYFKMKECYTTLTLMNMDSLIFLAKLCPSLPIIWKLL